MSGIVYFVGREQYDFNRFGPIKIGFTKTSLSGRISNLQTGSVENLVLLAHAEASLEDEQLLHRAFWKNRIRQNGEWFWYSNDFRSVMNGMISLHIEDYISLCHDQDSEFELEPEDVYYDDLILIAQSLGSRKVTDFVWREVMDTARKMVELTHA